MLKLRKSTLLGALTWEDALGLLDLNNKHDYSECTGTLTKMLGNVVANPAEPKFRKIRAGNPNFVAKCYSAKGAPEVFKLVGFQETVEEGFLVLPESTDVALVQQGLDHLAAHAVSRSESEEKKRKLQQEKEVRAREARAQKAREEEAPAAYDAAVGAASAQMADEDEAMVEAIEEWMDAHPEAKAGRTLDAYEVERQVAGPGGAVVASIVGSSGTQYFDYLAHMKRQADGTWVVSKVEPA